MAPPIPPAIAVIIINLFDGIIKPYKIGSVTPAKIPVIVTDPDNPLSLASFFLSKLYKKIPRETPICAQTAATATPPITSPPYILRFCNVIGTRPQCNPSTVKNG